MVASSTKRWHPLYAGCAGWGPEGDHHPCPHPQRPHWREGRCAACYECQRLYHAPKDLFTSINDTGLGWGDVPMVGTATITPNGTAGTWHAEYDHCLGWGPQDKPNACKTPGAPHKAGGRCRHCASAQQRYDEDQRILERRGATLAEPAPAKRWSRNHDACIGWDDGEAHHDCATPQATHAGYGRCYNCGAKQLKAQEKAEVTGTPAIAPTAPVRTAATSIAPAAPAFEVYTQVGPVKESGPALTLRLDGSVTINAAAYEALGRPNFVELLYARNERTLGLRACGPTVAHARIVRHDKDNKRTFVSARGLLKFYAVAGALAAPASTRQYGDVLAVQLVVDQAQG